MASSFIRFRGFGFWAKDGFVEAMQLCLIQEIESDTVGAVEWVNLFKTELALQAFPMIYGGMSMELDEFLTDDERERIVLRLVDQIVARIITDPSYMTGETMHNFRTRA